MLPDRYQSEGMAPSIHRRKAVALIRKKACPGLDQGVKRFPACAKPLRDRVD